MWAALYVFQNDSPLNTKRAYEIRDKERSTKEKKIVTLNPRTLYTQKLGKFDCFKTFFIVIDLYFLFLFFFTGTGYIC